MSVDRPSLFKVCRAWQQGKLQEARPVVLAKCVLKMSGCDLRKFWCLVSRLASCVRIQRLHGRIMKWTEAKLSIEVDAESTTDVDGELTCEHHVSLLEASIGLHQTFAVTDMALAFVETKVGTAGFENAVSDIVAPLTRTILAHAEVDVLQVTSFLTALHQCTAFKCE